jgi:hypothetical protein
MTAATIGRSLDPFSDASKVAYASHYGLPRRRALLQEDLDNHVSDRVGTLSNEIDLVVGQAVCLVAQQRATTLDRD